MRDHGERTAVIPTENEDGSITLSRVTGRLFGPDGSEPIWRDAQQEENR